MPTITVPPCQFPARVSQKVTQKIRRKQQKRKRRRRKERILVPVWPLTFFFLQKQIRNYKVPPKTLNNNKQQYKREAREVPGAPQMSTNMDPNF